ncbi:4-hydroxybenzoate octaprenyltransferase, partial [Burkholderia multivorans]
MGSKMPGSSFRCFAMLARFPLYLRLVRMDKPIG